MNNRVNPLGSEPIGKLLVKFAVPSVIAMIVNSIYNIVDQIFIQRGVGSLGNQATTVAFPLITFTLAIALLICNGGAALASIRMGEKRNDEAEKILGNAFSLTVIFSFILCMVCAVFFEPLLKMLGATSEVMGYSKDYVSIILIGTVFMAIGSGLAAFVRADGSPKISMIGLVCGCVLNIILDPIFIFIFGWGVRGAALATIISQIVTAMITLWYLFFKGNLRIKKKYVFSIDVPMSAKFCALGISSFIIQSANAVVQICMNQSLVYYGNKTSEVSGNTAMTAMGIVLKVNMLIIGICVGIGVGAQPILGYNKGAHNYKRIKQTYTYSVIAATTVSTIGWILVTFFPEVMLSVFGNNDPEMIDYACKVMRTFLGAVFVAGFSIITSNYFQAVGKAVQATIMSLARQIIALLPLMLILPIFMGIDGVIASGFWADVISVCIGLALMGIEIKQLNKAIKDEL